MVLHASVLFHIEQPALRGQRGVQALPAKVAYGW